MRTAELRHLSEMDYSGTEALNTICSNLSFAGRDLKKIVITSCSAGEGKSFLSMQIARNFAGRGVKTALVDLDLRRSNIVHRYGMEVTGKLLGIAHYLAGHCAESDIVYRTDVENLFVLPVGRTVSSPIALLKTAAYETLMQDLTRDYDLIVIDTPPVGLVVDAAEIARGCDGVVLVTEYNKTRRRDLAMVKRQIEQVQCPILGSVVNRVNFSSFSSRRYYNKYYYSHYDSEYYRSRDNGKFLRKRVRKLSRKRT